MNNDMNQQSQEPIQEDLSINNNDEDINDSNDYPNIDEDKVPELTIKMIDSKKLTNNMM